jgi:hypothetical protein
MRRARVRGTAFVAVLCTTAIAVGCGDDDDVNNNAENYDGTDAEVATLVDDFANAGRDGDGTKICEDIFTTELADNIERESGQSCPTEVEDNLPEDDYELTIDSLTVDGETATVGVTDQDDNSSTLHVEKADGAWRVARVTAAG